MGFSKPGKDIEFESRDLNGAQLNSCELIQSIHFVNYLFVLPL